MRSVYFALLSASVFCGCAHSSSLRQGDATALSSRKTARTIEWSQTPQKAALESDFATMTSESTTISPDEEPAARQATTVASAPRLAAAQAVYQAVAVPEVIIHDEAFTEVESLATWPHSLVALEQLALSVNPTILEMQARVDAANGRWRQVGLRPNPKATFSLQEVGNEGRAGQMGASIGQEFVTMNKLGLNRNAAAWKVNQAKRDLEAQQLRVVTDVRGGFYMTLVAQERIRVAKELSDIAEQTVEKARALVLEQEPETVLTQAEIEAELASVIVQNMEAARNARWRSLAAVIGEPDMQVQELHGEISTAATEILWEEAWAKIRDGSPEIAAAAANVQQSRWALHRACAEATPNVSVQAGMFYDDSTGDPFGSVQLSLPIPIHNWNQGGISEARANVIAATNAVQRVELNLRDRLAQVFQNYEQARQQALRYDTIILAKAARNLEMNKQGYDSGQSSYLAVLTAQRSYSQAQLARLTALEQLWTATIKIEGLLLAENLKVE
jgi:cobalt-zinc-cadmium efflux system outer membrane protein